MNRHFILTLIAATGVVEVTSAGSAHAYANPASELCEGAGGDLIIVKHPNGSDIGLCVMPNGDMIEEWTLFRMLDGKKPALGWQITPNGK